MSNSLEKPTGDNIAARLLDTTQTYSLSEVTSDLMDAHAHRPGLFNQDLMKVNDSIHTNNMLSGFDIVGVNGKDVIARNATTGDTILVDSADPGRTSKLSSDMTETKIGANNRMANLAQDGSGVYTVSSGDSAWRVANDILTNQGIVKPSDNQIANYIKELEATNARPLQRLKIGESINIPPMIKAGLQSDFSPLSPDERGSTDSAASALLPSVETASMNATPNDATPNIVSPNDATPNIDTLASSNGGRVTSDVQPIYTSLDPTKAITQGQAVDQINTIDKLAQEMHAAYDKIKTGDEPFITNLFMSHTQTDAASINSALSSTDTANMTDSVREGLKMLQQNYAAIKTNDDGNLYSSDIDAWAAQQNMLINQDIATGVVP